MLYIIPATKTESEVSVAKDEVSAMVAKYASATKRDDILGKQKLAYPIASVRYGYYVIVYFEGEPEGIKALDEELRHSTNVLRHMIVKAEDGAEEAEVVLSEYEAPDPFARRKPRTPKSDAPVKKETMTQEQASAAVKATSSGDELEKKLDNILESDIDKL